MMRAKRHVIFKRHEGEDDRSITVESLLDELVIWGTPDKVADEILRLRESAGPFGEIVYAGMDWVDPNLARRSMALMAAKSRHGSTPLCRRYDPAMSTDAPALPPRAPTPAQMRTFALLSLTYFGLTLAVVP